MQIGRTTREFVDHDRKNPFESDGTIRRFMASIYYPASNSAHLGGEPVYPELFYPGEDVAREFFESLGADMALLNNLKTNVYNDAECAEGCPFPVIVYSPAFGIERDMYWFNIQSLVANGFVVVTVGATYESVFTLFPDGTLARQLKSVADLKNTDIEDWQALLEIRLQDIRYVLSRLHELNESDELLRKRMDVLKIGLIGHSLGGAAVYHILKKNPSIAAGILLDPSLHLLGADAVQIDTPVLLLRQRSSTLELLMNDGWDQALAHATMAGQQRLADVLTGYRSFVKIQGANHLTFSDASIYFKEDGIETKQAAINEAVVSFLMEFVNNHVGVFSEKVGGIPGIVLIRSDGRDAG